MPIPQETQKAVQNGVEVTYNPYVFPKGKAKGNATLRGNFDELSNDDIIKLFGGEKGVFDTLRRNLHTRAHGFVNGATSDDGEFSLEDWQQLASGAALPGGDTLEEIEEAIDDVDQKQKDIAMKGFEKSMTLSKEDYAVLHSQLRDEIKALTEQRKELVALKAKKDEINRKRVEKRNANKKLAEDAAKNAPAPVSK